MMIFLLETPLESKTESVSSVDFVELNPLSSLKMCTIVINKNIYLNIYIDPI